MPIQYIAYRDIDKKKWDACIDAAANGLIYAYSYYLDAMAKNWNALVLNDYEAVMPLPWNKKYGINYLYQPFFCASLGVFGNNLSAELINSFLKNIPDKFKYCDIYLNHGNYFSLSGFNLYERKNFILNLNHSYENLFAAFRDNIKRNIRKSESLGCIIKNDVAINDVIKLAEDQAKTFSPITPDTFDRLKRLYAYLIQQNKAVTYGVYLKDELIASAAFFFSNNRAYYILVGNHPNGKTIGASHALINAFAKDFAGKNILLDFEGSDIHSLAFFYSSFGATEEKYVGLKLNKLPFWAKWLKK